MKKIMIAVSFGIACVGTSFIDVSAEWIDSSPQLAQAIGADLITDTEATDAASTPQPESQPAPATPESQPADAPTPQPVVSDTTV